MKHDSRHGTTCWFCGHPGLRTKTLETVVYQSCDACKLVKGTREEIRAKRNADVAGLQTVIRGGDYTPQYWSPAQFEQLQRDYTGLPAFAVEKLRWQEYTDSTWEATKERAVKGSKHYQAEFYKKLREERKQNVTQLLKEFKNE